MPKLKELLRSRLMAVYGTWQREGDVKNLIAERLEDLTPLLGRLVPVQGSRDSSRKCRLDVVMLA